MSAAATPVWLIDYEGVDVTDEIASEVTSVSYVDHLHGKSDELEIVIADHLALWRGPWYPSKGDRIALKMGYEGQALMDCGRFQVDTVELGGPGDTATVRALAAGVVAPLRTRLTAGFEGLSIADIVNQLAAAHGLTVVGEPPTRVLRRVTQNNETTLHFLKRLAEEYDFAFSVRGDKLVFYPLVQLEEAEPVRTLTRADLLRWNFRNGTQKTYAACEVSYLDPETGKVVKHRVEADAIRPRGGNLPPINTIPASILGVAVPGRRRVSKGEEVKAWQRFVLGLGHYNGIVDGSFGPLTASATRAFQRQHRLTPDGTVGPDTYAAAMALGFVPAPSGTDATSPAGGDVLKINVRAESAAEADDKARAALRAANRLQVTGDVTVAGDQFLVSGVKFGLADMSRLDGQYAIRKSTHTMTRGNGYRTAMEVAYV